MQLLKPGRTTQVTRRATRERQSGRTRADRRGEAPRGACVDGDRLGSNASALGIKVGHAAAVALVHLDAKTKRGPKARERMATLDPMVPRLRVVVPPRQASTTVSLDGQDLAADALEAPLPVYPGKHTLVFRAPGRDERSREIVLAPGERTEVVASVSPAVPETQPPGSPTKETRPADSGLRTGGFVTLGVGGAALLAAAITGGIVLARRSSVPYGSGPVSAVCLSEKLIYSVIVDPVIFGRRVHAAS